jgi:YHS domain-containing protein
MNIKLKTSLIAVALVTAATLGLVGLAMAASSAHQGTIDPSSPIITAAEPVGLLGPGKSDQELIEKQKTCPVSGAPLGSMGAPVKVKVKGRVVFLCCAGCKAKLLKNPDKYLEKLDKQNQKQGT